MWAFIIPGMIAFPEQSTDSILENSEHILSAGPTATMLSPLNATAPGSKTSHCSLAVTTVAPVKRQSI